MAFFTDEEFHKMLNELTEGDSEGYITLFYIAKNTLEKTVKGWCNSSKKMRGHDEDVMQEIYLRLIKKCVTGFLMKDGVINDDPDGFRKWMFTVAKNIFLDFAKKNKEIPFTDMSDTSDEESSDPDIPDDGDGYDDGDYDYDTLNRYFQFVLESSSEVHITITWLAVMIAIVRGGLNRSEATVYVTTIFSDATMDELMEFIEKCSSKILWLSMSDELLEKMKKKLDKTDSDGRRTGDKKYNEFYMKKGDRASVSDWVNRMNDRIIREVGYYYASDN